jgi:hypothetical protein
MDQREKTPDRQKKKKNRPVHVGFMVDKVALGRVFSRVLRFFPCQFYSTVTPLQGKTKKKLYSSQGCTISLKAAVRP